MTLAHLPLASLKGKWVLAIPPMLYHRGTLGCCLALFNVASLQEAHSVLFSAMGGPTASPNGNQHTPLCSDTLQPRARRMAGGNPPIGPPVIRHGGSRRDQAQLWLAAGGFHVAACAASVPRGGRAGRGA